MMEIEVSVVVLEVKLLHVQLRSKAYSLKRLTQQRSEAYSLVEFHLHQLDHQQYRNLLWLLLWPCFLLWLCPLLSEQVELKCSG